MKQFAFTIKDALGFHTRPVSQIVKIAKEYADTDITVERKGKVANATALMKLMSLGVRRNDVITVKAEGPSEDSAIIALSDFIWNNL